MEKKKEKKKKKRKKKLGWKGWNMCPCFVFVLSIAPLFTLHFHTFGLFSFVTL